MGSEGGRNAMHAWRVRIQTQDLLADICRFFPPTKKPAQRNFISPNEKMTVTYLFWQVEFEFGVFLGRRLIRFKEVTCFVKQVGRLYAEKRQSGSVFQFVVAAIVYAAGGVLAAKGEELL